MKQPELKYLDIRTAQRNIKLGFLKEDDHEKFIKSLPDDSDNFNTVSFDELYAEPIEEEISDTEPSDEDTLEPVDGQ